MITITREQAKDLRNAFQCWQQDYDPAEDKEQYDMFGLGVIAMDTLLASLEAGGDSEPVAFINGAWTLVYYRPPKELGLKIGDKLYADPTAPVVPQRMRSDYAWAELKIAAEDCESWSEGWNACRAAMQGAEPVTTAYKLPLDYLQGHKDGLEWASRLAEANHPQTGDWLYDDPLELAKAIRKGSDMPEADGSSPVVPDYSEDTKRLDWLDAQNKRLNAYYGTSYGWKFDANFQRNAMMLNDSNYPVMTVRQAIDEAIAAAPQQEVKNG